MRGVVQRVKKAKVEIENQIVGIIGKGLVVFVGIEEEDNIADITYFCEKVVNLRVFEDKEGKMNLSLLDIKGEILLVSQFTLYGDCRKGRRPNFTQAAKPDTASSIYTQIVEMLAKYGLPVKTGRFQAMMEVSLINDGPVTILLDSKKNF